MKRSPSPLEHNSKAGRPGTATSIHKASPEKSEEVIRRPFSPGAVRRICTYTRTGSFYVELNSEHAIHAYPAARARAAPGRSQKAICLDNLRSPSKTDAELTHFLRYSCEVTHCSENYQSKIVVVVPDFDFLFKLRQGISLKPHRVWVFS
ncbi:hypothetical protein EVAR_81639_1 [Eumeta japonica]|uniref:Uncharacterized protein n=1 Tax=Eumeta variegata TaxID=151549 RepID=A0A4C1WCG1_EUMVA|nr:hypothetical protein EVAR_81639_1 [Eumeta japonica]